MANPKAGADPKVDAWMPLWIGEYLADTMALSRDSHGGYLLLLFAYWRNKGPLVDDDDDLAGITKASPAEWKKLKPRLAKFFTVADGFWTHGRADKELGKALVHKATAVSKAKAGAEARWGKKRGAADDASGNASGNAPADASGNAPSDAPSMPQALPKQCPPPSPLPVSPLRSETPPSPRKRREQKVLGPAERFPEFWLAWPKSDRKQDKKDCLAKWQELDLDPVADDILADVRAKRGTQKWADGFIEMPITYLNNARWEDGAGQAEDEAIPNSGEKALKAKNAELQKLDELAIAAAQPSNVLARSAAMQRFSELRQVQALAKLQGEPEAADAE